MPNIFLLLESVPHKYDTSLNAGNMYINRFCIDEEASFELSGVRNLQIPLSEATEIEEKMNLQ